MKTNSNIFERIIYLADLKGIKNIPELASVLGYSNPEKLYRLDRKENAKPSVDMIEDFSNKFEDLNLRWLLTGLGEPLFNKSATKYPDTPTGTGSFNEDYVEYTQLPPRLKEPTPVKKLHPTLHPTQKNDTPTDAPTQKKLPEKTLLTPQFITVDRHGNENILYVPVRARAGYLTGFGDREYLEGLESYRVPGLNNGTFRAFEVEGVSMYPTLENKEMVIGRWVESVDHIREDRVHIIVTKNDGVIIKRLLNRIEQYGYIIAKSDAIEDRHLYENINIRPEDIEEIWYAVMHMNPNFKTPGDIYKRFNNVEADLNEDRRLLKELMSRIEKAGI